MFWKKKKIPTEEFTHKSSNKRETFRFEFDKDHSLEFEFKQKKFSLLNLSATGISFKNKGLLSNESGTLIFSLGFENHKSPVLIKVKMKIIRVDENNVGHGIFINCSEDQAESIHKYILEKQKQQIRTNKTK